MLTVSPAPPLGGGAGVALASATLPASQVSNSAAVTAFTSNSIVLWSVPHSSAHWPRKV